MHRVITTILQPCIDCIMEIYHVLTKSTKEMYSNYMHCMLSNQSEHSSQISLNNRHGIAN